MTEPESMTYSKNPGALRLVRTSLIVLAAALAVGMVGCKKKKKGGPDAGTEASTEDPLDTSGTLSVDNPGDVTLADSELKLGSSVALVAPKSETNLPISEPGKIAVEPTALKLQAGSDFETDDKFVFVNDSSMQALDQASAILCIIAQSAYTSMVGKGDYVAMVDEGACFDQGKNTNSAPAAPGETKDNKKKKLSRMVASATREPLKPLHLTFWLDQEGDEEMGMPPTRISAKVVVVKGATKTNPFGVFKMTYNVRSTDAAPAEAEGEEYSEAIDYKGVVEATESRDGNVFIKLYDVDEWLENQVGAKLSFDAATQSNVGGYARALTTFKPDPEAPAEQTPTSFDYSVAYDSQLYLAKDAFAETERCLDRENFQLNVYRYGVYEQKSGTRVLGGSSYRSVRRELASGSIDYGGYDSEGLYFSDQTPVADGDKILVEDPTDWEAEPSVFFADVKPGRLYVTSETTMPLDQARATRFVQWVYEAEAWTSILIKWNDQAKRFDKVAVWEGKNGSDWDGSYVAVTPVAYADVQSTMSLYPEGSSNEVVVTLDDNGLLVSAALRLESLATNPGTLTLRCAYSCPRPGLTQAEIDANDLYFADAEDVPSMHTYTFESATGVLKSGGQPVTLELTRADGSPSSLNSGPLVTQAIYDANADDPSFLWGIAAASTTYRWTSGTGSWDRQIALVDGNGVVLALDPAIQIAYEHVIDNDLLGRADSAYYGTQHILELSSWGDLIGIPWVEVDAATGYWAPGFSIKDGGTVGSYKVKGLDIEERMPEVDRSQCAGLDLTLVPELPTGEIWKDPEIGTMPDVTKAPAVITGSLVR